MQRIFNAHFHIFCLKDKSLREDVSLLGKDMLTRKFPFKLKIPRQYSTKIMGYSAPLRIGGLG